MVGELDPSKLFPAKCPGASLGVFAPLLCLECQGMTGAWEHRGSAGGLDGGGRGYLGSEQGADFCSRCMRQGKLLNSLKYSI